MLITYITLNFSDLNFVLLPLQHHHLKNALNLLILQDTNVIKHCSMNREQEEGEEERREKDRREKTIVYFPCLS